MYKSASRNSQRLVVNRTNKTIGRKPDPEYRKLKVSKEPKVIVRKKDDAISDSKSRQENKKKPFNGVVSEEVAEVLKARIVGFMELSEKK